MHPFLDASKLTDEEIIERLGRAYTYMNAQVMLGHNPTVHSIKEVIQTLEDVRLERQQKSSEDEFNKKYPDKNKPLELGKLDD
jgi:nucleoid-associated protein YejK